MLDTPSAEQIRSWFALPCKRMLIGMLAARYVKAYTGSTFDHDCARGVMNEYLDNPLDDTETHSILHRAGVRFGDDVSQE